MSIFLAAAAGGRFWYLCGGKCVVGAPVNRQNMKNAGDRDEMMLNLNLKCCKLETLRASWRRPLCLRLRDPRLPSIWPANALDGSEILGIGCWTYLDETNFWVVWFSFCHLFSTKIHLCQSLGKVFCTSFWGKVFKSYGHRMEDLRHWHLYMKLVFS